MNANKELELKKFAARVRIATLTSIKSRGFGHVGGCLSSADAIAALYSGVMNIDPKNPHDINRDKLVCSKGHAGPLIYATLALSDFFSEDLLLTLNQPKTKLPSHCDKHLQGIDATTGSLGQGTSTAVGIALADKLQNRDCRTFLLVGDGELNEGQCWEAAMFTAGKKINNLTWIIDWNKKQLDGTLDQILPQFDLVDKFKSFGFEVVTVDGHDIATIYDELSKKATEKPRVIILDSIKGCGVNEVEQTEYNHSMNVDNEVFDRWIAEVQNNLEKLENI